jgi:hypothetical protein
MASSLVKKHELPIKIKFRHLEEWALASEVIQQSAARM